MTRLVPSRGQHAEENRTIAAWRIADRATLLAMAAGLALVFQPWWTGGFRLGFFVTLGATVAQIVASHVAAHSAANVATSHPTDETSP